jgi:DNA-binding CsgD family transcriptional regulator/Tfp pilus assembly protein PilF
MAAALWRFWWIRGYVREGRAWLQQVLELADDVSPADRAPALYAAAELSEALSDTTDAIALHTAALAIYEELNDAAGRAQCLNGLGIAVRALGKLDEAERLHNEALPLLQGTRNRRAEGSTFGNLAAVAYYRGDFTRAENLWEQALQIMREIGDLRSAGLHLGNLGALALQLGQHQRSIALQKESLAVARQLAEPDNIAYSLINLGDAYVEAGDLDQARDVLEESLPLTRQVEDRRAEGGAHTTLGKVALLTRDYVAAAKSYLHALTLLVPSGDLLGAANGLDGLGRVASETSLHEEAIRFFAAAHHIRQSTGAARESAGDTGYDQALLASRTAVGRRATDDLWREGSTSSLEALVVAAESLVSRVEQLPAMRREPVAYPAHSKLIAAYGLTPREIDVLGLLITHHSDREIAEALYISPRTVGTHVTSIRTKLGVSSRRDAARIAEQIGMA